MTKDDVTCIPHGMRTATDSKGNEFQAWTFRMVGPDGESLFYSQTDVACGDEESARAEAIGAIDQFLARNG